MGRQTDYVKKQRDQVRKIANLNLRANPILDADDVEVSVFRTIFRNFQHPEVEVSTALLNTIARRKSWKYNRYLERAKRNEGLKASLETEPTSDDSKVAMKEILETFVEQAPERVVKTAVLAASGMNEEEIAAELGVSDRTVRRFVKEAQRIILNGGATA